MPGIQTAVVKKFLPAFLIAAIWQWSDPSASLLEGVEECRALDTMKAAKTLSGMTGLHSFEVFQESASALKDLKKFQQVVRTLARTVDKQVDQAEQSVLPAYRYYGLRSLPYELIFKIVTTIALAYEDDCYRMEKMMTTLSQFSIFHYCTTQEPSIRRLRAPMYIHLLRNKSLLKGGSAEDITHLDTGPKFVRSPRAWVRTLALTPSLEYLRIAAAFDLGAIDAQLCPKQDEMILKNLRHLDITSGNQWRHEYDKHLQTSLLTPLKDIIAVLTMPNLRTITATLFEYAFFHNAADFKNVFGVHKDRRFPSVQELRIRSRATYHEAECMGYTALGFGKAVRQAFPNVQYLTLRGFNCTAFTFYDDGAPWRIKTLRIVFDDNIIPDATFSVSPNVAADAKVNVEKLRDGAITIGDIEVVSRYNRNLETVQEVFPKAIRCTNKSILQI